MKKAKILLIVIAVFLIILFFIWILTSNIKNKKKQDISYNSNQEIVSNKIIEQNMDLPIEPEYNIELVTDRNMFYSVEQNISKYLKSITDRNKTEIYNFLDDDYIQKFSVTTDNVLDKVENYSVPLAFTAQEMYEMTTDLYVTTYYVKGLVEKQINGNLGNYEEYNVTLNYDYFNKTFSIIPFKYMFANIVKYENENEKIKVKMEQYVVYMDKVIIKMNVTNKTNNKIDISNGTKLSFYEDENKSSIIEKSNETINPGNSQEVILTFSNNIKTPKDITIFGLNVPVIKNQDTKN